MDSWKYQQRGQWFLLCRVKLDRVKIKAIAEIKRKRDIAMGFIRPFCII